jgi:hypothetical protein
MTKRLPLTKGALVALALIVVIALGGYVGLIAPARREVRRLAGEINALSAKLAGEPVSPVPISPSERASQRQIEGRLRERFPPPEDQLRAVAEITDHARAAGVVLTDVEILGPGGPGGRGAPPLAPPATLALNPGIIRLAARHRYRELVGFVDRLVGSQTYMAVEALQVKRVEDYLESEIRLVSLRWQP